MSLQYASHLEVTANKVIRSKLRRFTHRAIGALLTFSVMTSSSLAGSIPYEHPWKVGDLIMNMNGIEVTAARADGAGFEIEYPSTASTILTKQDFRTGHVTQRDPNRISDLFVTAKGDAGGTLYRINLADGSVEAINDSLNLLGPQSQLGITSDGTGLYIYDGQNSIDKYSFDGDLIADNLITGVGSGGFTGTNQLHYSDGFVFIATGGDAVQAAPTSGGTASTILNRDTFPAIGGPSHVVGVWASFGRLFTSDSGGGRVYAYDVGTDGVVPVLSNPVLEGREIGADDFLGALAVDWADQKLLVASAGDFGSGLPARVLSFDINGEVEEDSRLLSNRNVVSDLPNGGLTNIYRVTGIPEPSSLMLLLAAFPLAFSRLQIFGDF